MQVANGPVAQESKPITVRFGLDLLAKVDAATRNKDQDRSRFIRAAVREKLAREAALAPKPPLVVNQK